ncbi:MAG: LemA family protein [Candidatus Colwellbacteria bacterium]|nr:LemA family protein [Candidatus Colwellbacteria bacterium]
MTLYIIGGIVVLFLLWLVATFNRLTTLKVRSTEALSDIDVQLKRRFDLIPNLVETVRGYMSHEKEVFENVTKARSAIMTADGDPIKRADAENQLSGTLKTLFAVAENYPDLKANANFLDLQREIADTENKIQASRRFYNGNVRELSIVINMFPSNIVAKVFGFGEMKFFEVDNEEERKNVKVQF